MEMRSTAPVDEFAAAVVQAITRTTPPDVFLLSQVGRTEAAHSLAGGVKEIIKNNSC